MIRRAFFLTLPALLLLATPVHAQDDDLAPLVPAGKPKPKPKPAKPKPAKPAKPSKPSAASQDDDLTPLVTAKTEILVKLAVEVPGAKLYLDNKEVGPLPQGPQAVSAGDHAVLVKRPGFAPFTRKVTVGSGKTAEVTAELKASMAVLSIISEPSGAQVWSAGKALGTTPLDDVELPPGFVTLIAKKEGYPDAKTDLMTKAGKDYPVTLKFGAAASTAVAAKPAARPVVEDRPQVTALTPDNSVTENPVTAETKVESAPPIVTRWYFWVGVVAVAGAIAAGTAIGVSQANTTKPLTQQEICGGQCDACINCSAAFKF